MEPTCVACATPTARDGWCPRCLAAVPAPSDDVPAWAPPRTAAPPMVTAHTGRHTDRSSITFGPVGRTVWTAGVVLLPVPLLALGGGFTGWGFAALWWVTITPWALRDLWRSGRRRRVL